MPALRLGGASTASSAWGTTMCFAECFHSKVTFQRSGSLPTAITIVSATNGTLRTASC